MARYGRLLTDAQWEKIRPLLPRRRKRPPVPIKARRNSRSSELNPSRHVLESLLINKE